MKTQFRKSAVAAALAVAFGVPALEAQAVLFCEGGGAGCGDISTFNLNAGNYLFDNVAPTASSPLTTAFTLLGQTVIGNFGASVLADSTHEYTLVVSTPMLGNLTGGGSTSVTFSGSYNGAASTTTNNFFDIYYSTKNSNDQQGTGFTDGVKILHGTISNVTGFSVSNNSSGGTPDQLVLLDQRSGTFATPSTDNPPFTTRSFTQTAGSPGGGACVANNSTCQKVVSISASGTGTLTVDVLSVDAAFFPVLPSSVRTNFIMTDTPQFDTGFSSIPPAISFSEVSAGTKPEFGTDTVTSLGLGVLGVNPKGANGVTMTGFPVAGVINSYTVNNFQCGTATACDFLTEGTGHGSLSDTVVPEPATVGLLGLGLALIGFRSRANAKKA